MSIADAIISTLAYHDIFDYPLTEKGIFKYLIEYKTAQKKVAEDLQKLLLEKKIGESKGFFYLKNRKQLAVTRKTRGKISQKKLKRANFYSKLLSLIPSVRFIGVTGALAMNNSHKNDDIDLLVITSKGTLWTTRFLANIILFPFKRKPQPSQLNTNHYALITNNKACLNIFLDESDLKIKDQNLYAAHEIAQIKPLQDKNKTYNRFIKANAWLFKYLPNWQPPSSVIPAFILTKEGKAGIQRKKKALVVSRLALSVEISLKKFQLWYMRKKITTERIGNTQLFFHPKNTQRWVLNEYQKRINRLSHSGAKL